MIFAYIQEVLRVISIKNSIERTQDTVGKAVMPNLESCNEIHVIVNINIDINFMMIQTVQWLLIKCNLPFIDGNYKSIIII